MSVWSVSPSPAAADAGVLQLLADHLVVAEVVDAAAAVLLRDGHAQEPGGAGGREQLAGHDARLVPLEVVRRDLPLDERAEAVAEQIVVLGELRAAHAARLRPRVGQAKHLRATTRRAGAPAGATGRTGFPFTWWSADRSIHSRSPHGGSTSCAFGSTAATCSDVARVWYASLSPLRNTSVGHVERGGVVGSVSPGTSSSPHGQYASIHRSIVAMNSRAILVEDALPVRRVAVEHLFPLGERGDGLHAVLPRLHQVLPAVVHAQAHEPEGAAADPPDREPGGDLGVAGRGEHRHPRAARPAADHGRAPGRGARSSAASVSACMADSDAPVKHTSDAPQFGRS